MATKNIVNMVPDCRTPTHLLSHFPMQIIHKRAHHKSLLCSKNWIKSLGRLCCSRLRGRGGVPRRRHARQSKPVSTYKDEASGKADSIA